MIAIVIVMLRIRRDTFVYVRILFFGPACLDRFFRLVALLPISFRIFVDHRLDEVPANAKNSVEVWQKAALAVVKDCIEELALLLSIQAF